MLVQALSLCLLVVCRGAGPIIHSPVYQCCKDLHLSFGLPGAAIQPYFDFDATAPGNQRWSGFIPKIIDAISAEMGFSYTLQNITSTQFPQFLVNFSLPLSRWPYNLSIVELSNKDRFQPAMIKSLSYTAPFYEGAVSALVLRVTDNSSMLARVFSPFATSLWVAIIVCLLVLTCLLTTLNVLDPGEKFHTLPLRDRISAKSTVLNAYNLLASLLNGEQVEWYTWSGRLFRIAVLFLILVISSSYTANLAAFLTTPSTSLTGPSDMISLQSSVACTNAMSLPYVDPGFIKKQVQDPRPPFVSNATFDDYQDYCIKALMDGTADVFLANKVELTRILAQDCANFGLVDKISLATTSWGFALHRVNSELAGSLSVALNHLKQRPAFSTILQESFQLGQDSSGLCQSADRSGANSLTFKDEISLFFVVAVCAGAAFLVGIVQFLRERRRRALCVEKEEDDDEAASELGHRGMTESELLQILIQEMKVLQRQIPAQMDARLSIGSKQSRAFRTATVHPEVDAD